ncbi:hypothetical protein DDB_G0291888 [Dictyostelium discoideum AX4]|uniref:EamA domain-containing protein n=1 Tax=Dictyostelium discoideum TaxID=44689 RepID=Q54E05_DICDI|nr:hypothetical protein DDB_G0291888 [Dictyostelium discoideum AX4]EAL61474.1 hypothetical protein DDB_G0291888 [Dictyostelium discoideum AX4]|eukprot:XP_629891.1 hypothetical protein DDB_G0291888 [Dictyostelium discoideum AX4]
MILKLYTNLINKKNEIENKNIILGEINSNNNINNNENNENSNNIDNNNKCKLGYDKENINNDNINNNNNTIISNKIIKENKKGDRNKFLGIIIVILITIFQTGFSELSSFVVTGDYNSPFMIGWFNTIFLLFSFLIEFILIKFELNKEKKELLNINNEPPQKQDTILKRFKSKFKNQIIFDNETGAETISPNGITLKKLIIISIPITILYIILNWLWVLSLSMTETSIATALYQSATVFCFFLSIIILKEKIRILKSLSILIFMGGLVGIVVATTTTTTDGDDKFPNAILGDILMIVSAFLWGLYEVLTSKFIGDANRTIVNTYMGLIGLFNLIIGIPIIIILNFIKFELFKIPDSYTFIMILVNAIVGFSVLYLIVWGLSVTSPLFVRSGELMTIPSTLIFDILFKKMKLPLLAIPGYILIVIGFVLSVFIESRQIKKKEKLKNQKGENGNEKNQKKENQQFNQFSEINL